MLARSLFKAPAMRQVVQVARPRAFSTARVAFTKNLTEIKSSDDLITEGAPPGAVPTDLEQSTGLERLEILAKMAGVDVFDMQPIKIKKLGTIKEPIMVDSLDTFRYVGCTGEHESHETLWVTVEKDKTSRCPECGSVYKLNFIGDEHAHDGHH